MEIFLYILGGIVALMCVWRIIAFLYESRVGRRISNLSSKASSDIKLMEVVITTNDGAYYSINTKDFSDELSQGVKSIEWVWLTILFLIKMLYIIGNDKKQDKAKVLFLHTLDKLSKENWDNEQDVWEITKCSIAINKDKINGKKITASLYYVDVCNRNIWTEIPIEWYEYQFYDSWMTILTTSLDHLDHKQVNHLKRALKHLNEKYKTISPASSDALFLGSDAFNETAFDFDHSDKNLLK